MGIRTEIKPLGSRKGKYKKGTVLCNLSNGQTAKLTLYPGIYYIRAQGGGGGGGDGSFANGCGGGSGAGFVGTIRIKRTINVDVYAGLAGARRANGENTYIGSLIVCGGGIAGLTASSAAPYNGGTLTTDYDDIIEELEIEIKSNGLQGIYASTSSSHISGANSVLTNSGGGRSNGNRAATAPGAGGGGGTGAGRGGAGYYGECLIRYEKPYI